MPKFKAWIVCLSFIVSMSLFTGGYVAGRNAPAKSYDFGYDAGYIDGYAAVADEGILYTKQDLNKNYHKGYDEGYAAGEESYIGGTSKWQFTQEDINAKYNEGYNAGYAKGASDKADALSVYKYTEEEMERQKKASRLEGWAAGQKSAEERLSSARSGTSSSSSSGSSSSKTQSMTVYVTNTGEKYHRYGCQYLAKSCIAISLDDAKSSGYTACSRCW